MNDLLNYETEYIMISLGTDARDDAFKTYTWERVFNKLELESLAAFQLDIVHRAASQSMV